MAQNTSDTSTNNKKRRTLPEIENDSDEDSDQDLKPPTHKKRKLCPTESESKESKTEEPITPKKAKKCSDASQFKICCYNLNGIRAAQRKGLEEYIQKEDADIVCFSEMKAKQSQNPCTFEGYEIIWNECTDKAGYAGTAILSKTKPLSITKGIGSVDGEGRAITVEYDSFYLVNTYVPNSGQNLKFKNKRLGWDKKMKEYLGGLQKKKPLIWTGDLNVAIRDFDVYDGETNKQRVKTPGFTPYERKNFGDLCAELDIVDMYRELYPKEREGHFTFFSTRARGTDMKKANRGWRLDYFVMSKAVVSIVEDVQIRKDVGCSDHVPLILTMKDPKVAL